MIVRYIVDKGTIDPKADFNWRFAPLEGTSVIFETGPAGAKYADSLEGMTLEEVGTNDDGFALFRLTL